MKSFEQVQEERIARCGGPRFVEVPFVPTNPTADRWEAIVKELDAAKAPDSEYRDILSTGSRDRLKRGETWRSRVLHYIDLLRKPR